MRANRNFKAGISYLVGIITFGSIALAYELCDYNNKPEIRDNYRGNYKELNKSNLEKYLESD